MTVTKSKKGRWIVLVSDEDVPLSQFVLFDVTNKIAVFKR